jgi:hypothetical protein
MEKGLRFLENWYRQQCKGDWEQQWGVKIGTLDNPGWTIAISLKETRAEGRIVQSVRKTIGLTTGLRRKRFMVGVGRLICPRQSRFLWTGSSHRMFA